LQASHAQLSNQPVVAAFYNLLDNLRTKYGIISQNKYNADEKGAQLGIGECVAALVDRDQK
ncbi:hypothetical protein FPV67DRAFT_1401571, partial [Lyophyllum atratum]